MTPEHFKQLIEFGRESTVLEFKESCEWDALKPVIARCILAMTNTRGGGHLIIGVKNDGDLVGLSLAHKQTYEEEKIKDYLSNYADPYVDFDLDHVSYEEKDFVVVTVREFMEVPVICKKDGDEFQRGAIYTRTKNRRPESAPIPDSAHMRELIELAVDKGNENLKGRGWIHPTAEKSKEKFFKQIEHLDT